MDKLMNYKRLIISLALPQLAGLVGSFFTAPAIPGWYASLEKPGFSPPNWLFGPAWITLYVLMGISIYLIWSKLEPGSFWSWLREIFSGRERKIKIAFWLFWLHLFFNASWSIIFFGLQNPGLAFINIIIIWFLIIVLMVRFWKINRWASYLLLPYFLWVSFAGALNYFIWYLN